MWNVCAAWTNDPDVKGHVLIEILYADIPFKGHVTSYSEWTLAAYPSKYNTLSSQHIVVIKQNESEISSDILLVSDYFYTWTYVNRSWNQTLVTPTILGFT